jgi:hypothetical protein
MKLTREQVYEIITDEGNYAKKYDIELSHLPENHADADKSLETWLLWMEAYLEDARTHATRGYFREAALSSLRKVLSLGVNCAMYHGLVGRGDKKAVEVIPPPVDIDPL